MKKVLAIICACLLLPCFTAYAETNFEYKLENIISSLNNGGNVEMLLGEAVIMMVEDDILDFLEDEGGSETAQSLIASADTALAAAAAEQENSDELAIAFCEDLLAAKRGIINLLRNPDFIRTTALEENTPYTDGKDTAIVDAGTLIPEGWTLETDANLTSTSGYTFADGKATLGHGFILTQYVKVEEGEHYSFTPTKADDVFCGVQVEFYYYNNGEYNPVNVNAKLYSPTTGFPGTVDTVSGNKVRKVCYTEDDFKFTTPIGCNVVKVGLTSYIAHTSNKKPGTVQGATLTVTDEVVTNGTFTRYSGINKAGNVGTNMDGWKATNSANVKAPIGAFKTNASAGAEQGVLLKANSTYKFSFKFAQNGANGTAPAIALVAQGDSAPINLKFHTCTHRVTASVSENTSLANDYITYEVIFTTSGEEGTLGNYVITLPKTNSTLFTWYDDISIMEIDTVTRVLPIYAEATTTSFASTDAANGIRYSYVQDEEGKTQKLIRATYEGEALVEATVLTPGEGLAVGKIANYDAVYSDVYTTKIFLWDGATLVPVWETPIVNEISAE